MKMERNAKTCYICVLSICVLFVIWLLATRYHVDDKLEFDNVNTLAVEMQEDGRQRVYSAVLPEAFESSQSILFKSTYATVEVMLDDDDVYTFETVKRITGKSPGTYWHVVQLPGESEGRELTIHLNTAYNTFYGPDIDIRYGSRGDCILALMSGCLFALIASAVSIVMGVACLLLYIRTVRRKEEHGEAEFLWIALFALTVAVWSLCESGFLQFLIPSAVILYLVDIQLLFMVAVPFNLFLYSLSRTKWKKGFLWLNVVYLAGVMGGMFLQMLAVLDVVEMLRAFYVVIALNVVYMFWAIFCECRQSNWDMANRLKVPLCTIAVFAILEAVSYRVPALREESIFLPLGAMAFILLLGWQQIEEHYRMREEKKLQYYEKLANTDLLTGAFNRNAYENVLQRLSQRGKGYGAVLFDLNDLKIINDNYGHEKGDTAIICCYEIIMKAFGDRGKCYRIGGDEFLVLLLDDKDVMHRMVYFNDLVVKKRQELAFPFSVALGYAAYDEEKDRDMYDAIKRSDAMRYLDNKQKKQASRESGTDSVN